MHTKGIQVQIARCIDENEIVRVEWIREGRVVAKPNANTLKKENILGQFYIEWIRPLSYGSSFFFLFLFVFLYFFFQGSRTLKNRREAS